VAGDCLRGRSGEGPELCAYRTVEVTRLDVVGQRRSRRPVVGIRPAALVGVVGAVPAAVAGAVPAAMVGAVAATAATTCRPVPGLPVGPRPSATAALVVLGPPATRTTAALIALTARALVAPGPAAIRAAVGTAP